MAKQSADLSQFSVRPPAAVSREEPPAAPPATARNYIKKATQITREANKQLAMLSAETDINEYELFAEALNLLFQKYGKPPVA